MRKRPTKAPPEPVQVASSGSNGGNSPSEITSGGDYNATSITKMVLNRGGWLNVFLLSLSLTSVVMSGFEHTLAQQIELAYFVPLLIGHGGNAGGQTVGAVMGAMASGHVKLKDWPRVVARECVTGLGAGTITCAALIPLLAIMKISRHVSVAILVTMPVLTVFASGLGAVLPFIASALGADPTIIAAPAVTTIVDVGGLLAYFLISQLVFGAFGLKITG